MFTTTWTPDATSGIDGALGYDDALRAKISGVGYQVQIASGSGVASAVVATYSFGCWKTRETDTCVDERDQTYVPFSHATLRCWVGLRLLLKGIATPNCWLVLVLYAESMTRGDKHDRLRSN